MQISKDTDGFWFKTKEGSYDLEASAKWIGKDLLVAIWGGERPHIGRLPWLSRDRVLKISK
jgi:hypothetical protein